MLAHMKISWNSSNKHQTAKQVISYFILYTIVSLILKTKGLIIKSKGWRDTSVGNVLAEQTEGIRWFPITL